MELSIHINTDSPTDIASARAVLDFVERGISDPEPRTPFVPVPPTAADAAPAPKRRRPTGKERAKASVNGRTSTDAAQIAIPGTEVKPAAVTDSGELTKTPPPAPEATPDNLARAVHAKNGKVGDVLDLLAPFKVTRVSELSAEQGVAFVAAAQEFIK